MNQDVPFLSPFDYVLLAEWEKQEIPLVLVLDAIREFSGRKVTFHDDHFSDLKQAVKISYANWIRNGAGLEACRIPADTLLNVWD